MRTAPKSAQLMPQMHFRRLVSFAAFLLFAVSCSAQTFQVHGRTLFLNCTGNAPGPTVILVSGAGGTSEIWQQVQPQIAHFARVCSYDRAGLGKSTRISVPQTVNEIVNDLNELLTAAKIPPPYVLVGHSIGGIYIRSYDQRFDGQVAAMVLVDSSHEEQIWRFAANDPKFLDEYPEWKDTLAMKLQGFLPPHQPLQWHFSKPLIVLEHGVPPEPTWHALQVDLASRSPLGKLKTAEHSDHFIQLNQPDLVIDSVHEVLRQAAKPPTKPAHP